MKQFINPRPAISQVQGTVSAPLTGVINMIEFFRKLRGNRRGATAVEYGLIVALIAVAASGAVSVFADSAIAMWEFVKANALDNL